MNIQAISGMNFMAKPAQIKRITPLSDHVESLLKGPIENIGQQRAFADIKIEEPAVKLINEVQKTAENYGRDIVKIAQSGDMLLINSGSITSAFNTNPVIKPGEVEGDLSKSLYETFRTNIRANVIAEERGLKKGIEYIEISTPETVGSKLNIVG